MDGVVNDGGEEGKQSGQEKGEGEEGNEGPEVEKLWEVDRGNVIGFIAENDAAVDIDEGCEGYEEGDVRD